MVPTQAPKAATELALFDDLDLDLREVTVLPLIVAENGYTYFYDTCYNTIDNKSCNYTGCYNTCWGTCRPCAC